MTNDLQQGVQYFTQLITTLATNFGLKILAALLIIVIGFKLVNVISNKISKGKIYSNMDQTVGSFSKSFINVTIKILLVITAAAILGIPMASIVAIVGSAGLALGLALQGSLSNIAGGFIILIFKPFTAGDLVCFDNILGHVTGISIFYTKILTLDGKNVSIPNSVISNATLTNISQLPSRRVDLTFDTAYGSDIETVKRVLLSVAQKHEKVLKDPAPLARLGEYSDSSLRFYLWVWCKNSDYYDVMFDMNEQVKKAFDENGIHFPFPQLDVHLDGGKA